MLSFGRSFCVFGRVCPGGGCLNQTSTVRKEFNWWTTFVQLTRKGGLLPLLSRAVRRRHGVGGGAPFNFGRRSQKSRRRGAGGQKNFFKDSRKNFVLSSKFSDDLFYFL